MEEARPHIPVRSTNLAFLSFEGTEYMQGGGHDGDNAMGDEDAQGSEVGPDDEHYHSFHAVGPHDSGEPAHLLANGHGLSDTSSGSQEHTEGSAVPAAPQDSPNENAPETASAPHSSQEASVPPTGPTSQSSVDDSQIASHTPQLGKPLQASESLATIPDVDQERTEASPYASTIIDGEPIQEQEECEATQPTTQYEDEPPIASENTDAAVAANLLGEKIPSANRLSVSYAGATRRLVIDAEAVPKLKVFRSEGRIEVTISLTADERGGFRGIAVGRHYLCTRSSLSTYCHDISQMEGCSEESTYISLELSEQLESDVTVPPLWKAPVPSEVTLALYLDKEKPLSEPRWVKTGDVQDWLRSMFGRMFWVAGDAADGWEKRVEVVDPDPVCLLALTRLRYADLGLNLSRPLPSLLFSSHGRPTQTWASLLKDSASCAHIWSKRIISWRSFSDSCAANAQRSHRIRPSHLRLSLAPFCPP